jgi:hypothetical protein
VAVDLNLDMGRFAAPGVEFPQTSSEHLLVLNDASVDAVFMSNFFEHLLSKVALPRHAREVSRRAGPRDWGVFSPVRDVPAPLPGLVSKSGQMNSDPTSSRLGAGNRSGLGCPLCHQMADES